MHFSVCENLPKNILYTNKFGLITNIRWIIKKARKFHETSTFALLILSKSLTVWIKTNYGKFLKQWEYQTT